MYLHRPFFQWVQRVAPKRVSVIGEPSGRTPKLRCPLLVKFQLWKIPLGSETPPYLVRFLLSQASHFDVKTPLAGGIPLTPMPPAGGTFWQECRKVNRRRGLLAILPEVLSFERRLDNSINPSSRINGCTTFSAETEQSGSAILPNPIVMFLASMPGQGPPHSSHHRHTIRISRHSLETSQSAVRP